MNHLSTLAALILGLSASALAQSNIESATDWANKMLGEKTTVFLNGREQNGKKCVMMTSAYSTSRSTKHIYISTSIYRSWDAANIVGASVDEVVESTHTRMHFNKNIANVEKNDLTIELSEDGKPIRAIAMSNRRSSPIECDLRQPAL